jgi:signal transduction histidine kinase/CheY-like chemotaxis protein
VQAFLSRTFSILLLILFLSLSAESADREILTFERTIDLRGKWKFKTGDDLRWANPNFNDSSWERLQVAVPWGKQGHYKYSGTAWYRLKLHIPKKEFRSQFSGITIGFVDSSYEVYVNGRRIGRIGSLPPFPKMEYDRIATFRIPEGSFSSDGQLVLALRVWKSEEKESTSGGPYERNFLLGPIEFLVQKQFLSEIPLLILSVIFFVVGIYHLHLYFRRRNLNEYLWCGVLSSFNATLYTFLRSQWKFVLTDNFILLKELEYFAAYTFAPIAIQVLWPVMNRRISTSLRIFQFSFIVLAFICLTPGLRLNIVTLPLWEISVALFFPYVGFRIIQNVIKGDAESKTIAVGLFLAIAAMVNDIAVDRAWIQFPRLMPYGFAALVLSMTISLSNRFSRVYSELDALRTDLERRVEDRTLQLTEQTRKTTEVNEKLSELNLKLSDVNTKLSERSRELAEASLAKSQFLANMSHELRTPLNAIIGYSEMIQEDVQDKGINDFIPALKKIREAGKHLLGIINDILDLSKIEAGNVSLHVEEFKISMMLEDLGTTVAPLVEKNDNKLELYVQENIGTMRGDIKRLRQVLLNLLSNAAKFTENGKITIEASRENVDQSDWIIFRVADTGIGMTDEQKSKVFQAFSQADSSVTRKFGGAGLGLVISKRFCQMMGGAIAFDSQLGKGSSFCVRLPAIPPDVKRESGFDLMADVVYQRSSTNGIVLVIDDDRSARDLMVRMISREGFRVITAWGGEEGLRLARDLEPSIITLDAFMPGVDGWSVLKELKSDPNLGKIPVIMVTMEEDKEKGLMLGASDFVPKPITREELSTVLKKYKR